MHIRISLSTRHKAQCPICCREIQPYAVAFAYNVAFCPACIHADPVLSVLDCAGAVQHTCNPADVKEVLGLCFWTPRKKPPVGVLLLMDHGDPEFLREQVRYLAGHTPPHVLAKPRENPSEPKSDFTNGSRPIAPKTVASSTPDPDAGDETDTSSAGRRHETSPSNAGQLPETDTSSAGRVPETPPSPPEHEPNTYDCGEPRATQPDSLSKGAAECGLQPPPPTAGKPDPLFGAGNHQLPDRSNHGKPAKNPKKTSHEQVWKSKLPT